MSAAAARRTRFLRKGGYPRRRVANFDTGAQTPRGLQRVAPSATRSRSINCV